MQRRLSSLLTFVYKFVVPTSGLGMLVLATVAGAFTGKRSWPLLGLATLFAAIVFLRHFVPLKSVISQADGLLVSNFVAETFVPYAHIQRVDENKFFNPRVITVWLRVPCRFGRCIEFVPYTAFTLYSDHPAATWLRARDDVN